MLVPFLDNIAAVEANNILCSFALGALVSRLSALSMSYASARTPAHSPQPGPASPSSFAALWWPCRGRFVRILLKVALLLHRRLLVLVLGIGLSGKVSASSL